MGATARHCLWLLALAAVLGLLVVPALVAGWAAWQGLPWAMDWPQSLRHAAVLGTVFCGLRLLLAGAGWLLRAVLRSY
ncbi:hypothetical protein N7340_10795 [Comamonas aquatica]|uniref:hypothetical protein n=1 Tax=Comamonas aquatica TaxID=225991 RepID=UPI0024475E2C|nr:hypothetical protein [Comamonas aquatica]MDH0372262.1 hypothetical protein [Comamonas aquatica]